jgi:hypothetical protein
MKNSSVFTTSLPSEMVLMLNQYAVMFKVPKNKILEEALNLYFERLKKAEYIRSFKNAASNEEMKSLAEDGLADYLKILEE